MIALAVGTGVGINTAMAMKMGRGRRGESEKFAELAIPLAFLLWLFCALLGYLFMPFYACSLYWIFHCHICISINSS